MGDPKEKKTSGYRTTKWNLQTRQVPLLSGAGKTRSGGVRVRRKIRSVTFNKRLQWFAEKREMGSKTKATGPTMWTNMRNAPTEWGRWKMPRRKGKKLYWHAGGHFLLPPEVTEQIAKVKSFKVVPRGVGSKPWFSACECKKDFFCCYYPNKLRFCSFFTLFLCVYPLLLSVFSVREMEVKGTNTIYIYVYICICIEIKKKVSP